MNCNPCCGCFPPITTYNPSAADNFPTILQQVEYLKALLKKYPSQQWFITQEKVTEETKSLNKLSILSNGREPQGGDFILGNKENGTTLLFQYTGVITEYVNYNLIYVGVFTNQELAQQALDLADTAKNAAQVANINAQAADTKAQAADTKAQQALDLATTNETDIGTLNVQVAELKTNALNKQNVKTILGALITGSGDIAPTVSFENGGQSQSFYRIFINKDLYNTLVYQDTLTIGAPKLKTIFGNQSIVGAGNIDLYKHHVKLVIDGLVFSKEFTGNAYIDIISSNNLVVNSLTNLETLLGNNFSTQCYGFVNIEGEGQQIIYKADYGSISSTGYQIPWRVITISDTVTTI